MAYNLQLKIQSISDLNRKLKYVLLITSSVIFGIALFLSFLAFKSYDEKSKALNNIILKSKLSKFSSNYEYQIVSIAAQPIFRNLLSADLHMINNINNNNPFLYSLKRQIASFTARLKDSTIFEGTIVYNDKNIPILTQGLVTSPYFITVDLCYRDSITSFHTGAPCLGKWKFYVNHDKLIKNLTKQEILVINSHKKNDPLTDIFTFDALKISEQNLPQLLIANNLQDFNFKIYILAIIAIIFTAMFVLIVYIMSLYKQNYFNYLFNIHKHLHDNQEIDVTKYTYAPKELKDLIVAVNRALQNKKLAAFENLAHDLKPPLKRLQSIANKLINPTKQEILNVYTQFYLSIHKMHSPNFENIDIKKAVYDCVHTIYFEHFKNDLLTIECNEDLYFAKASYSYLIRIISNLIDNALKATTNSQKPKIKIKLKKNYNFINLSILDNGTGINHQQINNIFLEGISFSGSTGKGLSFCKKMITAFGGKITCKSTPNAHTEFLITLPQSKAPFDFIDSVYINNNSRFVIIDDEQYFHHELQKILPNDHAKYHIKNLEELNFFFVHYHTSDDIFIIDYHFDDKVTGIEIINKYKLFGKAYIFSSSSDAIKETFKDLRKTLPILSKNHINTIKFQYIDNVDCILIDDDIEILNDAKIIAQEINGKIMLCLNNFLQLRMIMHLIKKTIPITLDNNIGGDETKGTELIEQLTNIGFTNIAIQSGQAIIKSKNEVFVNLNKGEFLYERA